MYNLIAFLCRWPNRKCNYCAALVHRSWMIHYAYGIYFCQQQCSDRDFEANAW
jgi:hypothetical protein